MHYVTPDLCDAYPELVQVVEPMFANFGGRDSFGGQIVTDAAGKFAITPPDAGTYLALIRHRTAAPAGAETRTAATPTP